MSSKEKLICLLPVPEKYLRERFSEWIDFSLVDLKLVSPETSEDKICKEVSDATILYAGPGRPPITRKIIESAPLLKFIQMPGAGYNELDLMVADERKIPVATTKGANAQAVAEHALMYMLVLLKHSLIGHEETLQGKWSQFKMTMGRGTWELGGKTLGIIGLGRIGKKLAQIVKGFGVDILYHNRNRLELHEEQELGVEYKSFTDLLQSSDIVSIHVPLNQETRGLIGRDEISIMKDNAIILNLARGGVVDEKAVVDAVKSNKLLGAGFDVFESEPLSSDNIFKDVGNVMLSSHIAGATKEAIYAMEEVAGRNIAYVLEGKEPKNLINSYL